MMTPQTVGAFRRPGRPAKARPRVPGCSGSGGR